jgi:hypothetical protein
MTSTRHQRNAYTSACQRTRPPASRTAPASTHPRLSAHHAGGRAARRVAELAVPLGASARTLSKKARWLLWSAAVCHRKRGSHRHHASFGGPAAGGSGASTRLSFSILTSSKALLTCAVQSCCPCTSARFPSSTVWPVRTTAIRTERFPSQKGRAIAQGGCARLAATEAWVYVCPDCQRAEDEWKARLSKLRRLTESPNKALPATAPAVTPAASGHPTLPPPMQPSAPASAVAELGSLIWLSCLQQENGVFHYLSK